MTICVCIDKYSRATLYLLCCIRDSLVIHSVAGLKADFWTKPSPEAPSIRAMYTFPRAVKKNGDLRFYFDRCNPQY